MRIVENYRITQQIRGRRVATVAPYALLRADGSLIMTSDTRRTCEAYMARTATPAPVTPTRDAQADRVAQMVGLPATTATGRCHYCGGPLDRHGRCTECI